MELPSAISEGDTIEKLKINMTEAIELVLESLEERAKKTENLSKKFQIESKKSQLARSS